MPPRTKACESCRRKRIKCDATFPQCLMCIRTGRHCSGIPDGPLIVDMTGIARHGMQKRKHKGHHGNVGSKIYSWSRHENTIGHRISQQAVVTEAFYARFLSYFTSEGEFADIQNRFTWLHHLPLLSTDGKNAALVLAMQATASAYCAVESANSALVQYAWSLYGEALRMHGQSLIKSRATHLVTVHMVSTSLLFSFFEAMQAVDVDAYRSHIYGTAKVGQYAQVECEKVNTDLVADD